MAAPRIHNHSHGRAISLDRLVRARRVAARLIQGGQEELLPLFEVIDQAITDRERARDLASRVAQFAVSA